MADEQPAEDEPVLTTRIDGEEVRLLVHIERVQDGDPDRGDPQDRTE